jgi:cellulose synthase operon protein B
MKMKKIIIIILILIYAFYVLSVTVQTGNELYSIQLAVFNSKKNADNFVKQLNNKGLEAYKISTSIYTVFYGIYIDKEEAQKHIDFARKLVKNAYLVKLNSKQHAVYLAEKGIDNTLINKEEDESDELIVFRDESRKQIIIKKLSTGDLKYTYRVIDDIELRGIKGESKWFFNVEKGMQVKDFKFNLYLCVNDLIRRDISYFTIYMNDLPIKSVRLKEAKYKILNNWEINIPVHLVKEGYNELKIKTHSRITDDVCEDDKNIANWVIVEGNTNYVIHYHKSFASLDISDFPKPFVGLYADDALGMGIIIPDNYTEKQISAALTLISYMKDNGFAYALSSNLITASDPSLTDYESLIYIGDFPGIPDDLKNIWKDNFNKQGNVLPEHANLYKFVRNDKCIPVLMIVSNIDESLIKAVKALKNSDIKEQMIANQIMLKADLDTKIREESEDDYIYLEELGLNGIEVQGSNQQVSSIGLRISSNQILANESSINLNIRYSDNLDFEKSMVSLYVNGVPIGSHKLNKEKRDLHSITFYMPAALRKYNYFDVRIVFELIPAGIITCERYLASVPWAYIEKDSNYFFPTRERKLMLFDDLPFPFSRDKDIDTTTIVMPEKPGREDLIIAARIAEFTGIGVKKNQGIIRAVSESDFNENYYDNNLVIFGTPSENRLIKEVNENLWFRYNRLFNAVLSNEKIELLPETSKTATFIELKTSPYNDNKGMMTMTSVDGGSIFKAIEYLEDSKRYYLTGDGAIISKNGDLKTFRFQKDRNERPFIDNNKFFSKDIKYYLIFSGIILLFLIISLLIYIFRYKKKS